MKKATTIRFTLFILAALIPFSNNVWGQQKIVWDKIQLNKTPKYLDPEITFLSTVPVIDGSLDKSLESLPVRLFETTWKEKSTPIVPVNFRLAYGTGFFYVYLEAEAEHLNFRDRSYQNGDGFVLLIAKPQPNGALTDEFYELACSAVNKPSQEWYRRVFWNYNVDKLFVFTSKETKLQFKEGNGKISFELLLPWDDVRPYHPWISDEIGFNLTFCKATEPNNQMWFTMVSEDESGKEFAKHKYTILKFQKPVVEGKPQTFVSFRQGHISEGEELNAVAVTATNKAIIENISISASPGGDSVLLNKIVYEALPGMTKKEFTVATSKLTDGSHPLKWNSEYKYFNINSGLTVVKKFDPITFNNKLEKLRSVLSKGNFSTIQFMIQDLTNKFKTIKSYETSPNERTALNDLISVFESAERGIDYIAGKAGFIRKAHRSKIDNTLQPYTVYLPNDYDKTKKYPLLVYLHGSASDEMSIQKAMYLVPKNFIVAAPLGRGKSNGFSKDNAQDDIAEVIAAVEEDYSIDAARILLAGFSMGGYGVYRTFYETPKKFRAIAVFSGGPNLGIAYAPDNKPPNFLEDNNLISFRNTPVFIFHGEKDLNVSLPITLDVAAKLKNIGAQVELQIEPNKGHERPGPSVLDIYMKWVEKVMK